MISSRAAIITKPEQFFFIPYNSKDRGSPASRIDNEEITFLLDNPTSDNIVSLIKYGALAWGDAFGLFVEADADGVPFRVNIAQVAFIFISYPGKCFHSRGKNIVFHQVDLSDLHFLLIQVAFIAQHYRIGVGTDGRDIDGFAKGNIQPFPLPDRIKRIALMLAQYLS